MGPRQWFVVVAALLSISASWLAYGKAKQEKTAETVYWSAVFVACLIAIQTSVHS